MIFGNGLKKLINLYSRAKCLAKKIYKTTDLVAKILNKINVIGWKNASTLMNILDSL